MRNLRRWFLIVLGLLVFIIVAGVGWWVATTPEPMPVAAAALESDAAVMVSQEPWLAFEPDSSPADTGLIFYPGGKVPPAAYAPFARDIATQGYRVVIVPMPLNLAVLGTDRATEVMAAYPGIQHWVIGGHSLGGSMAARFAHDHPDEIDGLVLWAAYPEASKDLSDRDLAVASIFGTLDGLATLDEIDASRALLPPDTRYTAIEGGNHAQFGWYGAQSGDNPAAISAEDQQAQIVASTLQLLAQVDEQPS